MNEDGRKGETMASDRNGKKKQEKTLQKQIRLDRHHADIKIIILSMHRSGDSIGPEFAEKNLTGTAQRDRRPTLVDSSSSAVLGEPQT